MLLRAWAALSVTGLAAAQLKACKVHDDCKSSPYSEGQTLDGAGVKGKFRAGANSSTAYCAQLNGTASCWPCQFTVVVGTDKNGNDTVSNENCYTYNGYFLPTGVNPKEKETWDSGIAKSGCDVCDETIPSLKRFGAVGTTCYTHDDCAPPGGDHYCAKIDAEDNCGVKEQVYPPKVQNGVCNSPFDCDMGTDATDCPHLGKACVSCAAASTDPMAAMNCDEMTPVYLKHFILNTPQEMLAIYLTLVLCMLVYPVWCLAVFVLKNFTRCCGGKDLTWGMTVDMAR